METMTPNTIRYQHIRNVTDCKANLESIGKELFGEKWLGFIKDTSFIHSEGFVTRKIEPIEGTPGQEFRETMKRAGLNGKSFDFNDSSENSQITNHSQCGKTHDDQNNPAGLLGVDTVKEESLKHRRLNDEDKHADISDNTKKANEVKNKIIPKP